MRSLIKLWIMLGMIFSNSPFAKASDSKNLSERTKVIHSAKNRVKLEPRIRIEDFDGQIGTTLSIDTIRSYLKTGIVFDNQRQYIETPYVIAQGNSHTEGGAGSLLYVHGIKEAEEPIYTIYKEGKSYKHPITKELLGFEAVAIGSAELQELGEISQFSVLKSSDAIENGARLLPSFVTALPSSLKVRPVKSIPTIGYILSVREGVDQIGLNQVVVISLGKREGIEEGNTLDIYRSGKRVRDPLSKGWKPRLIQLPDSRIGSLLVFQSYEKLSLALVVDAREIIHLLDKVKSQ